MKKSIELVNYWYLYFIIFRLLDYRTFFIQNIMLLLHIFLHNHVDGTLAVLMSNVIHIVESLFSSFIYDPQIKKAAYTLIYVVLLVMKRKKC